MSFNFTLHNIQTISLTVDVLRIVNHLLFTYNLNFLNSKSILLSFTLMIKLYKSIQSCNKIKYLFC